MDREMFRLTFAPLMGLFVIGAGNGFLASLTTVRMAEAGLASVTIGVVSSAFFIGLALGAFFSEKLIINVGHIRAYSCFAALIAATVLMQGVYFNTTSWFILRLINGLATVGVYLAIESWLLLVSDAKIRGRILSLYMIALYGSTMLGQANLGRLTQSGETVPFMIAAIFAVLSLLPIVVIPRVTPLIQPAEPLSLRQLLKITPTGVMGCFGSGLAISAIYTLLPLYLQRMGKDINQLSDLMALVILGAMLLQYPVGKWSDRSDKQRVLIFICVVCLAVCAAIPFVVHIELALAAALFLLGGGVFALYPVAVSHSADQAGSSALVKMIQGLLLINSSGAAISPAVVSPLMSAWGPNGFFIALGALNALLVLFFAWRYRQSPHLGTSIPYSVGTPMSPTGAELILTDELIKAAEEADEDLKEDLSASGNSGT